MRVIKFSRYCTLYIIIIYHYQAFSLVTFSYFDLFSNEYFLLFFYSNKVYIDILFKVLASNLNILIDFKISLLKHGASPASVY